MRSNKNLFILFVLSIVITALYRVIPDRPMGFAPQLAMALFAGAVIKDRKWAFAFPIFSIFISDILYHFLFSAGMSSLWGFYEGQVTNYILFGLMTIIGFYMKKISVMNIVLFSFYVCSAYFLLSNFFVWINGGGYGRPKTVDGLILCFTEALPFFKYSIAATLLFSGIFFGVWKLVAQKQKLVTAI